MKAFRTASYRHDACVARCRFGPSPAITHLFQNVTLREHPLTRVFQNVSSDHVRPFSRSDPEFRFQVNALPLKTPDNPPPTAVNTLILTLFLSVWIVHALCMSCTSNKTP